MRPIRFVRSSLLHLRLLLSVWLFPSKLGTVEHLTGCSIYKVKNGPMEITLTVRNWRVTRALKKARRLS